MANVSLCTVCVILIVLYKPEALSLNIDRSLCLETIIKFMHDQHKCGFNYEHADELLKDYNVRCQTKCQVTINDMNADINSLKKVELGFGYETYEYEPCRSTNMYTRALNMNIKCLAWNKVKVPIGGYCMQDEQCHRTEKSGVCKLERCVCKTGYILSNFECHEGNLSLNQPCSFSEQCSGSPYASCLERKCSCIEGYTAGESNYCVPVKVSVGGYCTKNEQCHGSKNSGICDHGRCVCRDGYVLSNLECHEGNLVLNQTCSFSEQCTGSPYSSCLGGKCSCIEGYTAKNVTSCIQSQTSIFPKSQHNEEANIGNTLGALFGGLLLGVILTTVAAVFTYRRSKTHGNKRDELNVKFSDNDAVVDPNAFQNIHTKDEKRCFEVGECAEFAYTKSCTGSLPLNQVDLLLTQSGSILG
nr:uncharacterized protein LOC105319457 [Crassostrea gigas]